MQDDWLMSSCTASAKYHFKLKELKQSAAHQMCTLPQHFSGTTPQYNPAHPITQIEWSVPNRSARTVSLHQYSPTK
jgi:hypothetical protein